jgi:hypothetical protein
MSGDRECEITPLTLPMEIIRMVVEQSIIDLINNVINDKFNRNLQPIDLLRHYTNLLLTCQYFHTIIQSFNSPITMTIDDKGKYLFIKWGLRGPPTNRADRITREYHSIAKFLMDWQIEKYYQAMFARPRKYIKRFLEECGKVYLNPQFTTKDLGCVRGGLELIPLLLRFKRFFESRKEDVLKFSYGSFIEDFVSCTSPEGCCHVTYSVEEHVSITLDRSANRLISVAHWECEDDDTITNKMVTEEVTEWWIYTDWGEL